MAVTGFPGDTAAALEASVIHYSDASWPFLSNWQRLDGHHSQFTYASAVITDERSVTAYNKGSANGVVPAPGEHSKKPKVPLAAIVPTGSTLASDNPLVVVNAPWVTGADRDGAQAFITYALAPAAQRTVVAAGFRPGGGRAALANPGYNDVSGALDAWSAIRKKARLLILFDVSDSMGDPADPAFPNGPAKIARAQAALLAALDRLAPADEVGLRVFTTQVTTGPSTSWQDIVPVGQLAAQRTVLTHAIASLHPRAGSPLYTATRDSYDAMATHIDLTRINGVLLLTDGYNEDDANNDRKALLAHLKDNVRMFTIGYSADADMSTMTLIAWATNARVYDATNTRNIDDILPAAMSNF
jgi:Ca-activated chloride channel family protein